MGVVKGYCLDTQSQQGKKISTANSCILTNKVRTSQEMWQNTIQQQLVLNRPTSRQELKIQATEVHGKPVTKTQSA